MPVPARRLVVVLGLLVVFWIIFGVVSGDELSGSQALWVLAAANVVLLVSAVVDYVLATNPKGLSVSRIHADSLPLGKPASLGWRVDNLDNGRDVNLRVADHLPPSFQAGGRRASLRVSARSSGEVETAISPSRRGRFELDELVVRSSGPLGLLLKQTNLSLPTTVRVIPPFKKAKEAQLVIKQSRMFDIGTRTIRRSGGGSEFDSLRELTPDDDPRHIDWGATARSMEPVVRTYRAERNQTLLCVVNSGRSMAGLINGSSLFDHMVDASMLLAEVATSLGDKAGLVAFDSEVNTVIPPSSSRSQRVRFAESMFALEPDLSESDYSDVVTHILANFRRRSFLVLMTELSSETIEEFLVPVLPLLMRTHIVVVASVRDDEVLSWVDNFDQDPDSVYRRAAAIEYLEGRQRTIAKLKGMGVTVVDEPSEKFATRLGQTYLNSKVQGQI